MEALPLDGAKSELRLGPRPVDYKRLGSIAGEWDSIAALRDEQMRSGRDVSFDRVLAPALEQLLREEDRSAVFDAGCGTGVLAERIADRVGHLIGVDISEESIRIAQSRTGAHSNLTFIHESIQSFANTHPESVFSCAIANMVLMDVLDLNEVVRAVRRLLRPGGGFIFSITHPVHWPAYKEYQHASWFSQDNEIAIEAPFTISNDNRGNITTHVHRPWSMYQSVLESNGFSIKDTYEPQPDLKTEAKYPQPWERPRFLVVQCQQVDANNKRMRCPLHWGLER